MAIMRIRINPPMYFNTFMVDKFGCTKVLIYNLKERFIEFNYFEIGIEIKSFSHFISTAWFVTAKTNLS